MRTSFTAAIAGILLLTGHTVAVEIAIETVTIMSTVTVVPLPMNTPSGIFYSRLASGTGSVYAQPTGHHYGNGTRNSTYPSSTAIANGTAINSATSIPFFTIQTTGSLALATNSSSLASVKTSSIVTSVSIPNSFTSISIKSTSIPTLTTSIIPFSTKSIAVKATSKTSTTSSSVSAASVSPSSAEIPFLRGVNLGGWLVLEFWMDGDLFSGDFASAVDQYTFDQISGAKDALEEHWSTFFVEQDISDLADAGINALRIPIGYWAYDNSNTPYITGADQYLEQAIGWARTYGMKVWVDCHGSPGSQNGFDNSGQKDVNEWQTTENLAQSIAVLKTMAQKYGAVEYADVVVGLELVNEPISYGNNLFSTTKSWAQEAYAAVKAVTANDNLVIVMHDAFETPIAWLNVADVLLSDLLSGAPRTFGIDTHLYGLYTDAKDEMTQAEHITDACGWADNLLISNAIMPTYVGEWSASTNICVNPDGSTTAGTSCSVSGCQCQSADFDDWNDNMIEVVRKYVEAQLDVFESSSSGYFMWAAKGPGGWGFLNGIQNGIVPNPVTSRKYASQCGSSLRREVRGSLGVAGESW